MEKAYLKLNTEAYDAPILNTWLDRPPSMAECVTLKTGDPLHPETRLVRFERPILIVPNQSLHMNRKVNEAIELNTETDVLPLLARVPEEFDKEVSWPGCWPRNRRLMPTASSILIYSCTNMEGAAWSV